jgi:hypothetical protein
MDELVRQAMAKWPHVPACHGWLALDRRGQWYMRDDRVQALGTFQSGLPGSRGSVLRHEKLIDFIGRNYASDEQGCWYFQNGPQRVFVELESTPYVWRLDDDFTVRAHTGQVAGVNDCLVDEQGHVYLQTTLGFGLVHSLDVGRVAQAMEEGLWQPRDCLAQTLASRYGFVLSPQAQLG